MSIRANKRRVDVVPIRVSLSQRGMYNLKVAIRFPLTAILFIRMEMQQKKSTFV